MLMSWRLRPRPSPCMFMDMFMMSMMFINMSMNMFVIISMNMFMFMNMPMKMFIEMSMNMSTEGMHWWWWSRRWHPSWRQVDGRGADNAVVDEAVGAERRHGRRHGRRCWAMDDTPVHVIVPINDVMEENAGPWMTRRSRQWRPSWRRVKGRNVDNAVVDEAIGDGRRYGRHNGLGNGVIMAPGGWIRHRQHRPRRCRPYPPLLLDLCKGKGENVKGNHVLPPLPLSSPSCNP